MPALRELHGAGAASVGAATVLAAAAHPALRSVALVCLGGDALGGGGAAAAALRASLAALAARDGHWLGPVADGTAGLADQLVSRALG